MKPISIYVNWASYDELSDDVELTETLAMQQLEELCRLKGLGVQFDYYLMDAFWFAPDGGYRAWRKPHWSDHGPEQWMKQCQAIGLKTGLWFTANNLHQNNRYPMQLIPEWQDSFDSETNGLCCFYGGFLPHFMQTLEYWYRQNVRLFKIDFANFDAAPAQLKQTMLPSEIRNANIAAWQGSIKAFRKTHPDALFLAYNGFEELPVQTQTDHTLRKAIDHRWLEVFDALYCGDPRPADIPTANFWRSKDIYSDHMVRFYQFNNIPLERIDNAGFMIGTTGTCYYRGKSAWRGMLILSLARGGFINTYYGNLDLLTVADGHWFSQVQTAFFSLHARTSVQTFGGLPGCAEPYGYISLDEKDGLFTLVNPSQRYVDIILPLPTGADTAIIFHDDGFFPTLTNSILRLGPEQMAVVGTGQCATYQWGIEPDILIPTYIEALNSHFLQKEKNSIQAIITKPPRCGKLRVIFEQKDKQQRAKRSSGGSPPDGISLGAILRLEAKQADRIVPIQIQYDKVIWSGLSWAVGEIAAASLVEDIPVVISCSSTEVEPLTLSGRIYHIKHE